MHLRIALLVALLLASPLTPSAAAQESALLQLIAVDSADAVPVLQEATFSWRLVSNDPGRAYQIVPEIDGSGAEDWDLRVEPAAATLEPGATLLLEVHVRPGARPEPRELTFTLNVLAVNGTEALVRLSGEGTVTALGSTLVLGHFENPLPPPLDDALGVFLLDLVAWLLISLVAMWIISPTLKAFTARTKTNVDDHIIKILRLPVFVLLFTFGIKQSLEVFRLPTWVFRFLDRLWLVVLVVAIVYVTYRLWQEVVLVIGRRLAARSETKLDKRLLPVFDKMGGIVILVVGLFYIVGSFGINLTVFAAGGVLVSMVIAFAAQDTLSTSSPGCTSCSTSRSARATTSSWTPGK